MLNEDSRLDLLLARISRGDHNAFRALHQLTHTHLLAVARRILRRRETAEDVLQEVYLAVWFRAHRYRPDKARPMTWLITMTRNRAIDLIRSGQSEVLDFAESDEASSEGLRDFAADLGLDPARIGVELKRLSAPQRQSVALAYLHELSHREIAERLDAPLGSVKSWLRRGLQHLRQGLSPA